MDNWVYNQSPLTFAFTVRVCHKTVSWTCLGLNWIIWSPWPGIWTRFFNSVKWVMCWTPYVLPRLNKVKIELNSQMFNDLIGWFFRNICTQDSTDIPNQFNKCWTNHLTSSQGWLTSRLSEISQSVNKCWAQYLTSSPGLDDPQDWARF